MKIHHIMRICLIFAIYMVVGCTTNAVDQAPAPGNQTARLPAFYTPENQYYYFTAAQIQRRKGNLDKAIVLLRKAIELDAESPYLKRELATVYLQNKEGGKKQGVWQFGFRVPVLGRLRLLCIRRPYKLRISNKFA